MLGAFIKKTGAVSLDSAKEAFKKALPESKHNLLEINEEAIKKGMELV